MVHRQITMSGLRSKKASQVQRGGHIRNLVRGYNYLTASCFTFSKLVLMASPFRYLRKFEKYYPSDEFPGVDATLRGSNGPVKSEPHILWSGAR